RRYRMRFTPGLLAATAILLGSGRWTSQTRTVTGVVLDSLTNDIVSSGQVSVSGTTTATTIDAKGTFSIEVPDSDVVLRVRSIGFKAKDVTVPAGQDSVRVKLSRDYFQLEAIVITGQATGIQGGGPPGAWRYNPNFNTEEYGRIVESKFVTAEANPLSTFSIDVDRASYSNMRRFINDGQRPPIDAVRIEELVNYFPYNYPEPSGDDPVSITAEVASAPWSPAHRLLKIGLKAPSIDVKSLPANNLVFLLDVSGSMDEPNKLPLVKQSLGLLVNQLRPQDRVA